MIRNILLFLIVVAGLSGMTACHDVTVGFLITETAGYDPDSMVVRRVLDLEEQLVDNPTWLQLSAIFSPEELEAMGIPAKLKVPGKDDKRHRLGLPWVGTMIQGVDGTKPIHVSITNVYTESGDARVMQELLTVRGDGTFQLPADVSSVPVGRYRISLNFRNEGYSKDVNDCFTVIVE